MVRYEEPERGWWVEVEGAADMPMDSVPQLYSFESAVAMFGRLVKDHNLTDWDGNKIDLGAAGRGLSRRQFVWLREKVLAAVGDEELDPEA